MAEREGLEPSPEPQYQSGFQKVLNPRSLFYLFYIRTYDAKLSNILSIREVEISF
jgi:hypothetical protein